MHSLVPVWVQSAFDDARGVYLLAIDRDDSKWIGKPEKVALDQRVGRDD